jgi:hypothetical protein
MHVCVCMHVYLCVCACACVRTCMNKGIRNCISYCTSETILSVKQMLLVSGQCLEADFACNSYVKYDVQNI